MSAFRWIGCPDSLECALPTGFGRRLADRRIRHLRTQISTPWTNGKIEAFGAVLQRDVLDRQRFANLVEAEVALTRFAEYYNYHRLSPCWEG